MTLDRQIEAFLRESNAIEGITRDPTPAEKVATKVFLQRGSCIVEDVIALQAVYAPDKPLRGKRGMDVMVGQHRPPPGGAAITGALWDALLIKDPWRCHVEFEKLHPFMDGNGRTGRAIWVWKMLRAGEDPFALGFLHRFYYQTLAAMDRPA